MKGHGVAFVALAASVVACGASSASSAPDDEGPNCAALTYIEGDACVPLRINDPDATLSSGDDATGDASDASDADASSSNAHDAANEAAPTSAVDAGFDPATACLTADDSFVIGGDDYIHRGAPLTIEGGSGWQIEVQNDPSTGRPDRVQILMEGGNWTAAFSTAKTGLPLAVASYSGAERDPIEDQGSPGLSVYGNGAGCNAVSGSFQILTLDVGPSDAGTADASPSDGGPPGLRSFTATFVQHCEAGTSFNVGCVHITQ